MVLLIPKRIKKLKAEGRREGLREGRREGRAEERERMSKAIARFKRSEITIDELRRLASDQD